MTTHHSVPAVLAAAEAEFSARLRASSSEGERYSPGMTVYRKIVRENISGVLQNVFPLFCHLLQKGETGELADAFLHQHHASQPEFHQVATELLLFLRQQPQITSRDRALIEYEWLMYAVEIDDSEVPLPEQVILHPAPLNDIEVIANPTLKMMVLPFWIKEGEPCYEEPPLQYYYVIYRKHNNALYQKRLNQADVLLLSEINQPVTAAELMQGKASGSLPEDALLTWLEANNNDELLSLKLKG